MSEEFMINQKKVIFITNEMLGIFEKMEEDTRSFEMGARRFDESMMQSEVSKNALAVANDILRAVKSAKDIIKESVTYTKDSAELINEAEELGKKIGEDM